MSRFFDIALALLPLSLGADVGFLDGQVHRAKTASSISPKVKVIAGVPVLNYDMIEKKRSIDKSWIIKVKSGATDEDMKRICAEFGCSMSGRPSRGGAHLLSITGMETELERLVEFSGGLVDFIEPNLKISVPEVMPATHDHDDDEPVWGLQKIGADSRGMNGDGVHVYILDTGVRVTHHEFGARGSAVYDYYYDGPNKVCDSTMHGCAADRQGHGTHCGGTATGKTYGVASGAWVHAVKVLSDEGSGSDASIASALDYLTVDGARPAVASMSLGGNGQSQSDKVAVDAAVAAGIVVVVAAGNDADDACHHTPAFVPSAVTVGASDSMNLRATFTNFGTCLDIHGPGVDIKSAWWDSDDATNTISGTSMACPHVSGAAALIQDTARTHGTWTSEQVFQKLMSMSAKGMVLDRTSDDPDAFLYVSAFGAPERGPAMEWKWTVEVKRDDTSVAWGARVYVSKPECLQVAFFEEGPITDYNNADPHHGLMEGDQIVSVNGITDNTLNEMGSSPMLDEWSSALNMTMGVRRWQIGAVVSDAVLV